MFKKALKTITAAAIITSMVIANYNFVSADEESAANPNTEITEEPIITEEPEAPVETETPTPTPKSEVVVTPADEATPTAEPGVEATPTEALSTDNTPADTPVPTTKATPTPVATKPAKGTPTPTNKVKKNTPTPKPTKTPSSNLTLTPSVSPEITPTPYPYLTVIPPAEGEEYPEPEAVSDKELNVKSPVVIKIDGIYDDAWDNISSYSIDNIAWGTSGATGTFKIYWDKEKLYVLVDVTDDTPDTEAEMFSRQDCVELFINESCSYSDTYGDGDSHYKVNRAGEVEYGNNGGEDIFNYAVIETDYGYMVEASIEFLTINPVYGQAIGFDVRINDSQGDQYRDFMTQWSDTSMYTFQDLSKIGTLHLK